MSEEMKKEMTNQQSGMTRRTFIKGAAAGVAMMSLASVLPANEVQAKVKTNKKVKKNGIYIEGGNTNLNGQTYSLEFIQPVYLKAYIDGVEQTEGIWRTSNKHLVSVDVDGTVVMRDGVGGYYVDITWTLGSTVYTVTFYTQQTIGAACIDVDRPMTRGDLMIKLYNYFGWCHYNNVMDDGTDIDENGNILSVERVRNYYDVTGRADYVKPIEAALDMGVLTAESSDECFYPLSTLTREDAAVIICSAFLIAPLEQDYLKKFSDVRCVEKGAYAALNALIGSNYMRGATNMTIGPKEAMTFTEANIIIDNLDRRVASPVWCMPTSKRKLVRCRPLLKCPTREATLHWRARAFNVSHQELVDQEKKIQDLNMNGEWTEWKDFIQGYTTDPFFGLQQCKFFPYDNVYHCVEMQCYASAPGKADSPVSTFIYRIDRPAWHDFAFDVLHEGDKNFPTVYRFFDNFQAAAYYIQGSKFGILYDGLMPTNTTISLADRVNELATTDWAFVLGHEHGDHNGVQPYAYEAGKDIYVCKRVGSKGKSYTITTYTEDYIGDNSTQILETHTGTYEGDQVHEIDEGYEFDLGNAKFKVYRLPGHENAMMVIHDAEHGLLFSSDIYGVNRYWVADQFSATGVRQDLLLSLQQQLMVEYAKNGGVVKELYTGHNRIGVGPEYLMVWEQCLQKLVDYGADAVRDDRRSDGAILSIEGDSLTSLNWCGFVESGKQKVATYTGQYDGKEFRRIEIDNTGESALVESNLYYPCDQNASLSNIEFKDATLVGHDFLYKKGFWNKDGSETAYDTLDDGSLKYVVENKFFPLDTEYDVKVKRIQNKVTLTPITSSTRASLTVNGQPASSRCPVTVSTHAPVEIVVTAPDGETQMVYTLNFVR